MTSASAGFTESEVEDAALAWLGNLGWTVAHGPDIAPHATDAERTNYTEVVLERRRLDAMDRLNPALPAEALDARLGMLTAGREWFKPWRTMDGESGTLAKIMAGYHQFHAVRTAVGETLRATRLQREPGSRPDLSPGGSAR